MKQYQDLIIDCLENGENKVIPAREGQCGTIEIFGRQMIFNMEDGFPAVTTKKLFFRGVVGELLWILNGDTNVRPLSCNGIHIWDDDAYNYYKRMKYDDPISKEEFIKQISFSGRLYTYENKKGIVNLVGDMGNIYGKQLRHYGNENVDQLYKVIEELKRNPNSRRAVVSFWNPEDCWDDTRAALPACHAMWQLLILNGKLNLHVYQRSADLFLGVPFNISSYALLLHILSSLLELKPGELRWTGGSIHLYTEHIEAAKTLLKNKPLDLPQLKMVEVPEITSSGEFNFRNVDNYKLINYSSHETIKAKLIAGTK